MKSPNKITTTVSRTPFRKTMMENIIAWANCRSRAILSRPAVNFHYLTRTDNHHGISKTNYQSNPSKTVKKYKMFPILETIRLLSSIKLVEIKIILIPLGTIPNNLSSLIQSKITQEIIPTQSIKIQVIVQNRNLKIMHTSCITKSPHTNFLKTKKIIKENSNHSSKKTKCST